MPNRDCGGSFKINNPDDGSPIKEMFRLGEKLLFVTEKCTYGMQLADQIDPNRTNPTLPHNVQQKFFDHGTNSELLCNTLLLAKVMFRKECHPTLNLDQAMQLSFDALCELVSMDEAARLFVKAEETVLEKAHHLSSKDDSLALPALSKVRTQCKTFIQKADHFAAALMGIIRLFYPDQGGMNWDEFHALVGARFGQEDNYTKVTALTVPMLKLVRNTRDCLEHNLSGVVTTDFQLEANGTLAPPTIEVDFRGSKQDRCPVSWFMRETTRALLNAFEMVVVHTCAKHVQAFAGIPVIVGLLSEEYRKAWHVRFGYGMFYQDGQFAPFG